MLLRTAVMLTLLLVAVAAHAARETPPPADRAQADLVVATREHRASLERLLVFRARDVERAEALVDQLRTLHARGIVARREVEDAALLGHLKAADIHVGAPSPRVIR